MVGFSVTGVSQRLFIDINGVVTDKEILCVQPANNRCKSAYTLVLGNESQSYTAGPNDHSLSRDVEVGSIFSKNRWEIDYKIDNKLVSDFPLTFYTVIFIVGLAVLGFGYAFYRKGNGQ